MRLKYLYYSTLSFVVAIFCSFILTPQTAVAAKLKFTAQVQLSPITQLPANITFVPEGDSGGVISQVRAMLVLDDELLVIGLKEDPQLQSRSQGPEFRGVFPTPAQTLTYQFQITYKNGKAELTNRYEVSPECPGYRATNDIDRETRILLLAQQQKKRLEIARDLLLIERKNIDGH